MTGMQGNMHKPSETPCYILLHALELIQAPFWDCRLPRATHLLFEDSSRLYMAFLLDFR